jgi:hypothetical protein
MEIVMETKNWSAWIDLLPPGPSQFHVVGEVLAGNPGVQTLLVVKEPQGINPAILQLELRLIQQPGEWPQVSTWVKAKYDKVLAPGSAKHTQVQIFLNGASLATVPVKEVH